MEEKIPINVWINEERFEKLRNAGLQNMAKDVLAGMKVLQIPCNSDQKDKILKLYPMAKFDSATTKSIELIPAAEKVKMFDLVIANKDINIMGKFLDRVQQ